MNTLFESLLVNFARQTGILEAYFSAQGPVNLVFNDRTGVQISHDEATGEVGLASRLFQIEDEEYLAAIALMIAQANFEQDELHGSHLAMSEQGQVVLLHRAPLQALDNVAFDRLVTEFVDAAEKWSDFIAAMVEMLRKQYVPDTDPVAGQLGAVGMKA